MSNTVLLVDDEINILNSFRRTLRNQVDIDLAISGPDALDLIVKNQYAVIVTDMQMPEMNGLELLQIVKDISPDTVRMMFTGNAEQLTAVDAVNIGDVFRFINKPCAPPLLLEFIQAALRQYELVMAERVLLDQTLKGTISVLNEVLSLVNPRINEHNSRIQFHMHQLGKALELPEDWSFEPMVQLSQLGYLIFPDNTLRNINRGHVVTEEDRQLFAQHPCLAHDLLRKIPRMDSIARTILYQEKSYNGEGFPRDDVRGESLPIGSRMLKIVCDYTQLEKAGFSADQSIESLEQEKQHYDAAMLAVFKTTLTLTPAKVFVDISKLTVNMLLKQEVWTNRNQLVAGEGQRVTEPLLRIIHHCIENHALSGQVQITIIEEPQPEKEIRPK